MKIAWLTSDPAFLGKKTYAGDEIWTRIIIAAFQKAKHEIMWFCQEGLKFAPRNVTIIDKIENGKMPELLIVTWRYPYEHTSIGCNLQFVLQGSIINQAAELGIPILVFNMYSDKLTLTERAELKGKGVTIAEPSFFPIDDAQTLMLPNLIPFRYYKPQIRMPFMNELDLLFIGNQYDGRIEDFFKFMEPFSKEKMHDGRTRVIGKWAPHTEIGNVKFKRPINHRLVIDELVGANATIHLVRRDHLKTGTIGIRWAEAVSAATPAFVPSDFKVPIELEGYLNLVRVADGRDVIAKYEGMYFKDWLQSTVALEEFVRKIMRIKPWLDIAEKLACTR